MGSSNIIYKQRPLVSLPLGELLRGFFYGLHSGGAVWWKNSIISFRVVDDLSHLIGIYLAPITATDVDALGATSVT
ncbi:MAG: hypothetical protein FWE92_02590, partial [Defluviitaleaceae bacterium]|nr:hypothetical protein [Defluviitaleaceae bacterium]